MKRKGERTTPEQLRVYIKFLKAHPQMISRRSSPYTTDMVEALWREISRTLNAMRGPTRDHKNWKKVIKIYAY